MKSGIEKAGFTSKKIDWNDRGNLKPLSVRIHEQDIEDLQAIANKKGLNITAFIRTILRDKIQEEIDP